MIFYIVEKGCV